MNEYGLRVFARTFSVSERVERLLLRNIFQLARLSLSLSFSMYSVVILDTSPTY